MISRRGPTTTAGLFMVLVAASCSFAYDPDAISAGCEGEEKACDGSCVSALRPEYGCGLPGCVPCALPNARAICDRATYDCVIGSCTGSHEDCDGDASNGCERDLEFDVDHCGACGRACPALPPNAVAGCASGRCTVAACEIGYLDCDGELSNGCEVHRLTDADHCGSCGQACGPDQRCADGVCQ